MTKTECEIHGTEMRIPSDGSDPYCARCIMESMDDGFDPFTDGLGRDLPTPKPANGGMKDRKESSSDRWTEDTLTARLLDLSRDKLDVEEIAGSATARNLAWDYVKLYHTTIADSRPFEFMEGFGYSSTRRGQVVTSPKNKAASDGMIKGILNCYRAHLQREARNAKAAEANVRSSVKVGPETVPAGRYAVEEAGELHFFKVNYGKAGSRWAGFCFLDIQASDDLYPIKDRTRKQAILDAIAVDPKAAMARYGHEIGRCGICGRTLTDPESIENGIGPVCAERF